MPVIEIPDKNMRVEFPDDMPESEIQAVIRREIYGEREEPGPIGQDRADTPALPPPSPAAIGPVFVGGLEQPRARMIGDPNQVRPSIGGELVERWKRGKWETDINKAYYQKMMGDESPELQQRIDQLEASEPQGPRGGRTIPEQAILEATQTIPMMYEGMSAGARRGLAAGTLFGVTGALAGPEAMPFTAGAGFMAGFSSGVVEGVGALEAGSAYRDMLKKGMDPNIARFMAGAVGIGNGLLELATFKTIARTIPGADKAIKSATRAAIEKVLAGKTIKAALARQAAKYGTAVGEQAAQEFAQEANNVFFEELGTELNNKFKGTNLSHAEARDVANRLLEAAYRGGLAAMPFSLPGTVAETFVDVKDVQGQKATAKAQEQFKVDLREGKIPLETVRNLIRSGQIRDQGFSRDLQDMVAELEAGQKRPETAQKPAETGEREVRRPVTYPEEEQAQKKPEKGRFDAETEEMRAMVLKDRKPEELGPVEQDLLARVEAQGKEVQGEAIRQVQPKPQRPSEAEGRNIPEETERAGAAAEEAGEPQPEERAAAPEPERGRAGTGKKETLTAKEVEGAARIRGYEGQVLQREKGGMEEAPQRPSPQREGETGTLRRGAGESRPHMEQPAPGQPRGERARLKHPEMLSDRTLGAVAEHSDALQTGENLFQETFTGEQAEELKAAGYMEEKGFIREPELKELLEEADRRRQTKAEPQRAQAPPSTEDLYEKALAERRELRKQIAAVKGQKTPYAKKLRKRNRELEVELADLRLELAGEKKAKEPQEKPIEQMSFKEANEALEEVSRYYRVKQALRGVAAIGQTPETEALLNKMERLRKRISDLEWPAREAEQKKTEEEFRQRQQSEIVKRDKLIADAPVFRKVNGWEIVKVGSQYWVRDPNTKEEVYSSSKYKRAVEVANESKPDVPETKAGTLPGETGAGANLTKQERDFIDKKVRELGSVGAVVKAYPTDSEVDTYARERARDIFGESSDKKAVKKETKPVAKKPKPAPALQKKVEKLRKVADNMKATIDKKLSPAVASQTPTVRRSNQITAMASEARSLQRIQRTLRSIADGMEKGTLPKSLENVSSRADIETLEKEVRDAKSLAVSMGTATWGKPVEKWDMRGAVLKRTIDENHLNELMNAVKGLKGIKGVREAVELRTIITSPKHVENLEKLLSVARTKDGFSDDRHIGKWPVQTLRESLRSIKRLFSMGIRTDKDLQQALVDYLDVRSGKVEKSEKERLRDLERELVGMKIAGWFPTPTAVAERMADMADIEPGMKVLEPSAGNGQIADVLRERSEGELSVIEISPILQKILEAKGYTLADTDFLDHNQKYDRIVMNPPFEKGQDMDHVRHAYELLNPGGRLVSIMSEGVFFRGDKKATSFREWLDEVGGIEEKLPAGTFSKEISSTGVSARIVVIDKPGGAQHSTTAAREITRTPEFKRWFGKSKVVDENGEPLLAYHWSPSTNIESFNTEAENELGAHFGTERQANKRFEEKNKENKPSSTYPVFLLIQNPLRLEDPGVWTLRGIGAKTKTNLGSQLVERRILSQKELDRINDSFDKGIRDLLYKYKKREEFHYPSMLDPWINEKAEENYNREGKKLVDKTNRLIRQKIEKAGYDGIVYNNNYEKGGDSYIAFDPTQIKSVFNRGTFSPTDARISYATGERGTTLTPRDIYDINKDLYKGKAEIGISKNGIVYVKTRAGNALTIEQVNDVSVNRIAFQAGRGRLDKAGELVTGKYQSGRVELVRGRADAWTVRHENVHFWEDVGIINPLDRQLLKRRIQKLEAQGKFKPENPQDIGGAEDRANYLADQLTRTDQTGGLKRIVERVRNFIDRLVNMFTRTAGQVVREVQSGRIFEREPSLQKPFSLKNLSNIGMMNPTPTPDLGDSDAIAIPFPGNIDIPGYSGFLLDSKIVKGMAADSQNLGNLPAAQPASKELFGKLDINVRRFMMNGVAAASHNPQIFRSIVKSVPIDVMNDLVGEQFSPELLLQNQAMFKNALAVNANSSISPRRDVAFSALISKKTGPAAEVVSSLFDVARRLVKLDPAIVASNDHGALQEAVYSALNYRPDHTITQENKTPQMKAAALREGMPLYQIAGRQAKTAPTGQLARAEQMLAEGKSEQEVWDETGWTKEATGKWAFRIDDSKAKLKITPSKLTFGLATKRPVSLGEILDHKELYDAYPMLDIVRVVLTRDSKKVGAYSRDENIIKLNISKIVSGDKMNAHDALEQVLFHEIQHYIQYQEGFATGGSPRDFQGAYKYLINGKETELYDGGKGVILRYWVTKNSLEGLDKEFKKSITFFKQRLRKAKKKVTQDEYKERVAEFEEALRLLPEAKGWDMQKVSQARGKYMKLAGEIYAREAQHQYAGFPGTMEGIPRDQWIVKDGKGTSFSVEQPAQYSVQRPMTEQEIKDNRKKLFFTPKSKEKVVYPDDKGTIDKEFAEQNARIEAARGQKRPSWVLKVSQSLKSIKNSLTRHYPLLSEKRWGAVNDILRLFEQAPNYSRVTAHDDIYHFVGKLNPEQYNIFSMNVILPDLIRDIDAGLFTLGPSPTGQIQYKELPFGYESKEQIQKHLDFFQRSAQLNPEVKEALDRRGSFMRALAKDLVDKKLLPKAVLNYNAYFHHLTQMTMQGEMPIGLGVTHQDVKLREKAWQKARVGSSRDYNTEYVEAENLVIAQAISQIMTKVTLDRVMEQANQAPRLKQEAEAQGVRDWRELIPDDHTVWFPTDQTFSMGVTIPERMLQEVLEGKKIISRKDIMQIMAMKDRDGWVIHKNLAYTMDNFVEFKDDNVLVHMADSVLTSWKQWVLLNPMRAWKYNLNNMSGDLDIVLAYDPKILKYARKAARDLWRQYRGKNLPKAVRDELNMALKKGVTGSSITSIEIPDISETGVFQSLTGKKNLTSRFVEKTWRTTKDLSTMRENMLRLAAYRYFKDRIAKGETMYAASTREAIDKIADPDDRAARLARDLIGDYGNLTKAGQYIRKHLIPFYSWMEINAPRYVRLFRNLPHEGKGVGGRVAGISAIKAAKLGYRATKLGLKVNILFGLVALYNMTFWPDEWEELRKSYRGQMHIILGRREDGSIFSLRFQGAFSDALDWFGLSDLPQDVQEVKEGKKTVGDKIKEAALAPPSRLIQGARPIEMTGAQALFGYSLYPDVFNPRPIRDKIEHMARLFSLDMPYRHLMNKPTRPLWQDIVSIIGYKSDSGELSYFDTRKKVFDWLDKQGKEHEVGRPTNRGNALYYYKQALRLGDLAAAEKYLQKYYDLGGTRKGLKRSIKMAAPLASLSLKDKRKFMRTLTRDDRQTLKKAENWYERVYR